MLRGCRPVRASACAWALAALLAAAPATATPQGASPAPPAVRHYTFTLTAPRESRKLQYGCGDFACRLAFGERTITVQVLNRGAHELSIAWSRARLVDLGNVEHVLAAWGGATIDADAKVVTHVAPGACVSTEVLPLDHLRAVQAEVSALPLLPSDPAEALKLRGRSMQLSIPVTSDGEVTTHRLTVKVGYVERNVTCGAAFGPLSAPRAGLVAGRGAQVLRVLPGSPAEAAGLREGDLVLGLGEVEIHDLQGLWDALARCHPGDRVRFRLMRGERRLELGVELGEPLQY